MRSALRHFYIKEGRFSVRYFRKQKACSKAGFLNLAPLTGITFASNWLIRKLNLNLHPVKTTKMTTISCGLNKSVYRHSMFPNCGAGKPTCAVVPAIKIVLTEANKTC